MKTQTLTIGLTVANLALLLFAISQTGFAAPEKTTSTLRANALELVDDRGQVRARIAPQADGEMVLRLMDQQGTIRVKLGASADGSGLVLVNDATELGVQLLAKSTGSSLKLKNKDNREKIIAP